MRNKLRVYVIHFAVISDSTESREFRLIGHKISSMPVDGSGRKKRLETEKG